MPDNNRPLSPHLQVYSWQISNTTSILHRLTGVGLSLGVVCFVAWILSAALGPDAYASMLGLLGGPLGLLALFAFSASFFYHLANGIRHLCWDAGYGFDRAVARTTGWVAIISAAALTVLFWVGVIA
jgi:succinate dehydrogenase / fumarate reductase cytochrome b subunit